MRYAGLSYSGRIATRLATWFTTPYKSRRYLAHLNRKGYIAPSAMINHDGLQLGGKVFIGDRVVIYQTNNSGSVELGKGVELYSDMVTTHTFSPDASFRHSWHQFKLVAA